MANKAEAFRRFDFENNEKWTAYKSNLEIPAGKSVEQTLQKVKAKWYRREIDPDFDIASAVTEDGQAAQQPDTKSPRSSAHGVPSSSEAPHNGGTTNSSTAGTRQTKGIIGKIMSFVASSPEDRLFFLHLTLVVFFVLHFQPLARALSARSWGYFMQTALLTHGYKVYLKYGAPRIWPFSFQAIKSWMIPATASTDFQYALISMVFLVSKPLVLIQVPVLSLAVYHIAAYLAKHYSRTNLWQKYGSRAHAWLQARQQAALLYNASAEIGAGFLVIFNLLTPPRSFILVYLYWQFLKMRFWSPDAATYHRMVWSQINGKVGRYLDFVPVAKIPIGYIQRWFLNAPQASG